MSDEKDTTARDESSTDSELLAVSSTYKVLGELIASDGTGVLGRNNADSGTPIGVEGAVPNNDSGYGLSTPNDARVQGILETASIKSPTDSLAFSADGKEGLRLKADGFHPDVIGGDGSTTSDPSSGATISGGLGNSTRAPKTAIGGGENNAVDKPHGTVAGGSNNEIGGRYAAIGGGGPSDTANPQSTNNVVYDNYGVIGGGGNNQAGSDDGSSQDPTNAKYATVGGGEGNSARGQQSTVGGGTSNDISTSGTTGTVGGGDSNEVTAENATVGGGFSNRASGAFATVPGGTSNVASANSSFAAGIFARAADAQAFVWNDGSGASSTAGSDSDRFSSSTSDGVSGVTGNETFHVKAKGGARIITAGDNSLVTYIADGTAGWSNTSTRTAKTNVEPVDPGEALAGVESMRISTWEYIDEDGSGAGTRHIGPMAEDFHDAFEVGDSDSAINSINADGVAFAALQGLSTELEEKAERIDELEAENEALRERLAAVEDRLAAIEDGPVDPATADG